jgi:predicted glycosyltransferase
MKLLDVYYFIKPAIPRWVQLRVRRKVAFHKREAQKSVWPIDPGAALKPEGWRAWPGDMDFAFVLQHDVDSKTGLEKCLKLAELEASLGFRSSYNFVPEDYYTPAEIRRELAESGFEIGVHGLNHDGKTFRDARMFRRRAPKIRYYLKDWASVGYTSPSMLRNLGFMAELGIEHGCSTFDTDPFEPHSDGFRTIFPFIVGDEARAKSYVELPYTLPQDHCLFIVQREKDINIWQKKLDWIATNGGMALMNSHPDYMNFGGESLSREEYPVGLYREFLDYVRTRYAGRFWHAIPRDLARYWRSTGAVNNTQVCRKLGETYIPLKPVPAGLITGARPAKAKIWIDLDNTPHVPFFKPIIRELECRGHSVVITARDAFQVCELATAEGLPFTRIGHHYGKNRLKKIIGLLKRSQQLYAFCRKERPDIAVSHGARSQLLLAALLGIPRIALGDYEHARGIPFSRENWLIVPEAISPEMLSARFSTVRQYPGLKEDVYVPDFVPNPGLLDELDLKGDEIVVTVRPPADEAHYYRPESGLMFVELMDRLLGVPNLRIVMLPRNKNQEDLMREKYPSWFAGPKVVIPKRAVNGLNLLWYSDLAVSGGGTMNREAAAMNVPVYSIFRGESGAVDRRLESEGRLVMIRTAEEIWTKILIEHRSRPLLPASAPRPALRKIVDHIENIIEIEQAK